MVASIRRAGRWAAWSVFRMPPALEPAIPLAEEGRFDEAQEIVRARLRAKPDHPAANLPARAGPPEAARPAEAEGGEDRRRAGTRGAGTPRSHQGSPGPHAGLGPGLAGESPVPAGEVGRGRAAPGTRPCASIRRVRMRAGACWRSITSKAGPRTPAGSHCGCTRSSPTPTTACSCSWSWSGRMPSRRCPGRWCNWFEPVVRLNPGGLAPAALGLALVRNGDLDRGLEMLRRAVEGRPERPRRLGCLADRPGRRRPDR